MEAKVFISIAVPLLLWWYFFSKTFDSKSIKGKRVLITGASSGIGEHVAYRYSELGANLVLAARRGHLLKKVAAKCLEKGAQEVNTIAVDMADPNQRKNLAKETVNFLKGLDILILNHAMLDYDWWNSTADNMTRLQDMLNVNFFAYVDMTSLMMNELKKSKGNIGVVSSLAGKMGNTGFTHYCSSKFALQGFYSSLRQELRFLKTDVSVTVIVFGPVASENAVRLAKQSRPDVDFEAMAGRLEDAADALVVGVAARNYEVLFPKIAQFLVTVNGFIPGYLEDLMNWFQNS